MTCLLIVRMPPLATLTMRIVGKPRDRKIIPRGCSGFATIGTANLNFFRHQGEVYAFEHGYGQLPHRGVAAGGGRSSAMSGTITKRETKLRPRPREITLVRI